jgi:hypothetical protein
MSRHSVRSDLPGFKLVIGWDPPLHTFFVQVIDLDKEKRNPDNKLVKWLGCNYYELPDLDSLAGAMKPFADLTPLLRDKLRSDRNDNVA